MRIQPSEFKIVRSDHKLHFQFKEERGETTQNVVNAKALIKNWLSDNIEGDIFEGKFGIVPELVLDGNQMDEFDTKEEEFWHWLETKYKEGINNPKISREIAREEHRINEEKNLKYMYVQLMSQKDKDFPAASELIVKYILKNNFIYTTKVDSQSEMWIYYDGAYVPNGRSFIKEIVRRILQQHFNLHVLNLIILKIEADTYIPFEDFFEINYRELVPVENGILNVITRELLPFDPKKIFFAKLPVKYDPDAKCPEIDKFLKSTLSKEDDVKVYYEMAGYCLYKAYPFHKSFIFVGDGRNGKSRCLELVKKLIGSKNISSITLKDMDLDSFNVELLLGKMANISADIGKQDMKNTEIFKALSGGDSVTARRKFLKSIKIENYAKFMFGCNELPLVYDTSKGFWDRWILLDFPFTFVTKEEIDAAKDKSKLKLRDEDIISRISTQEELSGLLNKALDGLNTILKNKSFTYTQGSEEIKLKWIRKANSFIAFALDNLENDYSCYVTKMELRQKYNDYCKKHKLSNKSDFVIKKVMEETFGSSTERKGSEGDTVWMGVKFKETIKDFPCEDCNPKSYSPILNCISHNEKYKIHNSPNSIISTIKEFIIQNKLPVYYIADFLDLEIDQKILTDSLQKLTFEGFLIENEGGWKIAC